MPDWPYPQTNRNRMTPPRQRDWDSSGFAGYERPVMAAAAGAKRPEMFGIL
jgi:hypothetical protein